MCELGIIFRPHLVRILKAQITTAEPFNILQFTTFFSKSSFHYLLGLLSISHAKSAYQTSLSINPLISCLFSWEILATRNLWENWYGIGSASVGRRMRIPLTTSIC